MRIDIDVRGVSDLVQNLNRIKDDLGKAQATGAAINKVAAKAQAEINRSITQRYAIKADQVRNSVVLSRASAKADRLEASISIFGSPSKRGRSMNMIRFLAAYQAAGRAVKLRGYRGSKKELKALGVQLGFQILRGGGLKQIPGAFVGNKGRTVFMRVPGKQMPGRSGRLTKHSEAIVPVQVIGVSQMFNSNVISGRVLRKIAADLPTEMARAVEMILARRS